MLAKNISTQILTPKYKKRNNIIIQARSKAIRTTFDDDDKNKNKNKDKNKNIKSIVNDLNKLYHRSSSKISGYELYDLLSTKFSNVELRIKDNKIFLVLYKNNENNKYSEKPIIYYEKIADTLNNYNKIEYVKNIIDNMDITDCNIKIEIPLLLLNDNS